jgi:hypothetical protein
VFLESGKRQIFGIHGRPEALHNFLSLYAPAAKECSLPQVLLGSNSKPPPTPPAQVNTRGFLLLLRNWYMCAGRIFLEFAKFCECRNQALSANLV